MAGRIPRSFIDDLVDRADIVDVIGQRLDLKKRGREYVALCPFHDEKSPSFTVSPDKQFYHCFGCGAHGTALSFLMEHDHLDFVEAVENLAESMGLEVPREGGPRRPPEQYDDLRDVLEKAAGFYRASLRQSPEAIDYLKHRGISGQTARDYALGFAPDRWDALLETLGRTAPARQALDQAGLIKANEQGRVYDRFRNRVMFPIRDRKGRTIAFGGRIIEAGDDVVGPKYLNSPETPLFHKSEALYGFFEARQKLGRLEQVLVVEGYMDVIALAEQGIDYAVATLGTATTREHLEQLYRQTTRVVFCFDGDRAGRDAAWRALENALPALRDGREARFLFLPEGEDPDSLAGREGREAFEARLEHDAEGLSDFFFRALAGRHDIASREGRARMAREALPLLGRLPHGVLRGLMTERLAAMIDMTPERLEGMLEQGRAPQAPAPRRDATPGHEIRITPMRLVIATLVQRPGLAAGMADVETLARAELPGAELLQDVLAFTRERANATTASILEHWRGTAAGERLARLATLELPGLEDEAAARQSLEDALGRLEDAALDKRLADLLAKDASRERLDTTEKTELMELLRRRNG